MGLTIYPPQGDIDGPASTTVNAAVAWGDTTGTAALDGAALNILGRQFVGSFTTTATAAGTTTLTVSSNPQQEFTGVTTQTVVLPVVTTLPKTGFAFYIINNSTGALTVNSSGGNLVQTVAASGRVLITCVLLTGTTAASWTPMYLPATFGITNSAGANVVPKSDGTNLVASRITDNGTDTLNITNAGTTTIGDVASAGNGTKLIVNDGSTIISVAGADFQVAGGLYVGPADFVVNNEGYIGTYGNVVPTNGQILIGHTVNGRFQAATITAGAGISVTNGAGVITLASTELNSRVVTNVTNNTITPAVITGLSATLVNATTYSGRLVVFCSNSLAADGARFDFDGGTATASNFRAHGTLFDTGLLLSTQTTALATDFTVATMTGASMFECYFTITASANGTFIPRIAMNTAVSGTITGFAGSYMTLKVIA